MNKPICSLLLLLSSSFVLAACGGRGEAQSSTVAEVSITLNQTSATLEQYETLTLTAEVVGSSDEVIWTSGDNEIASVQNGKVTALKAGQVTITASVGGKKATCEVTVTALSQAPRIVMSDIEVSVDKDQTYPIDAYVLYKNEKIEATLEFSLKDGATENIAEVSYQNEKISVKGLAYGETTYIVHTKVLGITLSQVLRVKVSNSSLRLALKNATAIDDVYGIELINEKVSGDDSEYQTEFTPEVEFTEKGNPASYALTYTSSNEEIAKWENGKIVAKKNGEATLKISCEEFALSLQIDVTVYKGAYNLVLKNVNEDGTDTTTKVAAGKFPSDPTLNGKTFIGWYDLDGTPVEKIVDDTTLVARYTKEYRDLGNESLMEFSEIRDDYEAVDDDHKLVQTRSAGDKAADIAEGKYPNVKGQGVFLPWEWWVEKGGGWYTGAVGLKLPKFDFAKAGNVFFNFGITSSMNNFFVEGVDCGTSQGGVSNYEATVKGKKLTVHNAAENKDYEIALKDSVYNGEEGLSITTAGFPYRFMTITPFKALDCDYMAKAEAIEAALPDTPISDASALEKLKQYQTFRSLYSNQEEAIYPISAKMNAWIEAATPTTVMEFADKGASILESATGTEKGTAVVASGYTDKANCLQYSVNGCDGKYLTFTLPAYNYSEKARVTFSMGLGGGPGDKTAKYWLGAIPETADQYPMPNSLKALDNFIGTAPSGEQNSWSTVDATTVTIKDGKINFLSSSFDKTFDLDEEINTGAKGLTLTFGWCSWNTFVISPLTATQI